MPKYRVSEKYGEKDSEVRGYTIEAADYSDAMKIVLSLENFKIVEEKDENNTSKT